MCAFTLLSAAAFSFAALHASFVQSGYTLDVNAMRSLIGDHTGPVAPPFRCVSCRAFDPSASATQSWPPATYATCFPSADQRASVALTSVEGNACGAPPAL